MNKIPPCPAELPSELRAPLRQLADAWAASSTRPRLAPEVVVCWERLITAWADTESLPLYVRKSSNDRGSVLRHSSGRVLIPADNSPALWAYTLAYTGKCPDLEQVKEFIESDQIPIAFTLKAAERPAARFRRPLGGFGHLNQVGWKLAHIEGVGLNSSLPLTQTPLDKLKEHFRRFLSPANMFLVPKACAGLGELTYMIEAVRDQPRCAPPHPTSC